MVTETQIHSALIAKVESLSAIFSIPVSYPGATFTPSGSQYLKATHLRNTPRLLGISEKPMSQKRGFLQLDLFTPSGAINWQIQSDAMADRFICHFSENPVVLIDGERLLFRECYLGISDWDISGNWRTQILIGYLN